MKTEKTAKHGGRQGFLHGALILTVGMAVVKVIGALFKIPLKYSIGEYGMGLFNVAYNFYGPIFSLATAGFPVAVSRLVSESSSLGRQNDMQRVKRVALPLFLLFGGVGTLLMTLLAPVYCEKVIGNQNALLPMLALAPAILFSCMAAVYRGWFEGLQSMTPTAVSEVIEALVKLCLGLSLSGFTVSRCTEEYEKFGTVFSISPPNSDSAALLTLSFAAAAAVLGVTAGSAVSLVYLMLYSRFHSGVSIDNFADSSSERSTTVNTVRRLMAITLPIAAGSIATNAAGLIDAAFLQNSLTVLMADSPKMLLSQFEGMIPKMYLDNPKTVPTFLYGCYTLAMTVYLLVPALTQAFGVSALPNVTDAWARGDKAALSERISSVTRITAIFCFPAGLGISALSQPIVCVLYGNDSSAPIISGVLFLLGIASLSAAMCTPLSAMLQAVGRADLPVKLLIAAMTVKLIINRVLCAVPEINIAGAAVGTLVSYTFLAAAELHCLKKAAKVKMSVVPLLVKPLLAAALCAVAAWGCFSGLSRAVGSQTVCLAVSVAFGAVIYAISLILLGGIEKTDLYTLPNGQKIAKMLEKPV